MLRQLAFPGQSLPTSEEFKAIMSLVNSEVVQKNQYLKEPFHKWKVIRVYDAVPAVLFCNVKFGEHNQFALFAFELNFLETSLKNVLGYYESHEQSTRKYWVYLPPDYDKQATPYPMILFLDGSDYLNPPLCSFTLYENYFFILNELLFDWSTNSLPCLFIF